jgi:hypothetical protein
VTHRVLERYGRAAMRARQPLRRPDTPSIWSEEVPSRHPVLALQRLAGNRATAGALELARQPAPPGPNPLPPPPAPRGEFGPVAEALRARGASSGQSSPMVLRLQVLLNAAADASVLKSDGVYGPKTAERVLAFQLSTHRFDPAPSPNPLPPPMPPPPGPEPEPVPVELPATGEADPATVAAIERAAGDLPSLVVAKEGLRLVRDNRVTLRLSLLSAIQNVYRLLETDGLESSFHGTELTYWEAVAEHANGHTAKARTLYESVLADEDVGDWADLHRNCEFQIEFMDSGAGPHTEFFPDPNLEVDGPEDEEE